MWWTGLTEPPPAACLIHCVRAIFEDVLDLLEFLISRFKNVDEAHTFWAKMDKFASVFKLGGAIFHLCPAVVEAFRTIVSISDTKSELITLRVFSAALKAMDCQKFKGHGEI